jgi:hypothetical protein
VQKVALPQLPDRHYLRKCNIVKKFQKSNIRIM